jgi:hypothetical protein
MVIATLKTIQNTDHQTTQHATKTDTDESTAEQRKFAAKLRAIRLITRPEIKSARNVVNLFEK